MDACNHSELTFGYHPIPSELDAVLGRGLFDRAVVVTMSIQRLAADVSDCRFLFAETELPEGIYWFQGIEAGDLILQIGQGAPSADAVIATIDQIDDSHDLAAPYRWAEHYWAQAVPVPEPKFQLHQAVTTASGDLDGVVSSRFFSGQWRYKVAVDGRATEFLEGSLRAQAQDDDPAVWVCNIPEPAQSFGATLTRAKLRGKFANTLFSFRATRTTFRPYQFKPVLKLLETGKARILIADEVGLGKTIEAGLIWTELEARQEADRVLVVSPSNLTEKWQREMERRFGFEARILDRQELDRFLTKHLENNLPRRLVYIASTETLRGWDGLEYLEDHPPQFDLVIVDEAHSMRNKETRTYQLGSHLSEWADNLVFLTATPINLRQGDLSNLLELLVPEDFGSVDDLQLRLEPNRIINDVTATLNRPNADGAKLAARLREIERTAHGPALMHRPDFQLLLKILNRPALSPRDVVEAKRLLADLNTLSAVITRTKKVEVDDQKARREERRFDVEWTSAEHHFYKLYLDWCVDRAAANGQSVYWSMQMPLRLASACLPMARRSVLDPEFRNRRRPEETSISIEVEPSSELVAAARNLRVGVDSKFDRLVGALRDLRRDGKQALLFTFSRPTLSYLEQRCSDEFRVALLHGGVGRAERAVIMEDFRAGKYDFVFANRVASEGLDFEFCSVVINYDLPWNPMEIEQRIGRIDRIGQAAERMLILNFVNEATIDERILSRVLERIRIFESAIGALEPIIAEQAAQALEVGFSFALTDEQRREKQHQIELAFEEQKRGLQDVADASSSLMVGNEVDVAGLEDDLLRTGRYIGQEELAALIHDWATTDGAEGVVRQSNSSVIELRGNSAMAARVEAVAKKGLRTRAEVDPLARALREEVPLHFTLDQEAARTGSVPLLSATSPLAMTASGLPAHRQARFSCLQISAGPEDVRPGTYLVVMVSAIAASRGGDEIWSSAVTLDGRRAGEAPGDALLAALAEGRLADGPMPGHSTLPDLVERVMDQLRFRHATEQERRDSDFDAAKATRLVTLQAQLDRKLVSLDGRISKLRQDSKMTKLFEAQRRRARERFHTLHADLESQTRPEIRLEPLAVCVLEVVAP